MTKLSEVTIKVYTISDVAKLLMVNDEAVRKWIKSKELVGKYTGAKKTGNLIFDDDLQEFIDKHPKYRRRYNISMHAANDMYDDIDIKETTIKDFVLEYLYGVVPYDDFKTVSNMMDTCSILQMVGFHLFVQRYITKESYDIVLYAIRKGWKTDKEKQQVLFQT